jgi:bacteriorhodopsin
MPALALAASVSSYVAAALVVAALVLTVLTVLTGAVTALKGKWGFFFLGLFIGPLWIIGAIRPAKPDSYWARKGW